MVYEKIEKLAQIFEKEGGIVGGESKPVDDGTKGPKSSSKPGNNNNLLPNGLIRSIISC